MKKRLIVLFLFCLVAALMAGCGGAPADTATATETATVTATETAAPSFAGQKLVVQVWGGTYEETLREYVIKPFEAATGATVELSLGDAPIAQLKAQGNNPSVDVVHMGLTEAASGIEMGVLAKMDFSKMTNYADLYEEAKPNDYSVVTNWGNTGIVYRTDLVKEVPDSWEDLWDPAYKDKVGIWDISIDTGVALFNMTGVMLGKSSTEAGDWDAIFTKLEELKPNIHMFVTDHATLNSALTNGDVVMGVETNGRAIRLMKEGVPVSFANPKEGTLAMVTLVGIAAGSQHKELAEIFVDYCLAIEGQEAFATHNFYAPSNKKAIVPDDLKGYMPYGTEAVAGLITVDDAKLATMNAQLVERWNKTMK